MTEKVPAHRPALWIVLLAFACIYFLWGGAFLAIRFAIETIPPFLMAGARFLSAGAILYAWARFMGEPAPRPDQWPAATLLGGLLFVGCNGLLVWSEQYVSSGLAALIIATIPLWMVLLDWIACGSVRPTSGVAVGLILGFGGIALLLDPSDLPAGAHVRPFHAAVLAVAAACWAAGSLYSRSARLPASPFVATAMQLLTGGGLLCLIALAAGEWDRFDLASVTLRSLVSLGFLSLFGSIAAFTSYVWLLRVSTPARVSTYAYVNPVVALILGWALGGEPIAMRTLIAASVILVSVVIITTRPSTAAEAERSARVPDAVKAGEDV